MEIDTEAMSSLDTGAVRADRRSSSDARRLGQVSGGWKPLRRQVLRELESWSREHGFGVDGLEFAAWRAVGEVRRSAPWMATCERTTNWLTPTVVESLPSELHRWPADWRYRVADLERGGLTRNEAVDQVRHEHDASTTGQRPAA